MEQAAFSGGTSPPSPSSRHEITQSCSVHCCIWSVSFSAALHCQKPPRNERRAPASSPPFPVPFETHFNRENTQGNGRGFLSPIYSEEQSQVFQILSSDLLDDRWGTFPLTASVSPAQSFICMAALAEFLLNSSACRSPKHTSLLITYLSIPRGLYSADELQLCN